MNEMLNQLTTDTATTTAEALPHSLGCFEAALERVVERAADTEGLTFAGDVYEVWHGRFLYSIAQQDMAEQPGDCDCDAFDDDDE